MSGNVSTGLGDNRLPELIARKLCERDGLDPDDCYEIWERDPWPEGESHTIQNWEDYLPQVESVLSCMGEILGDVH